MRISGIIGLDQPTTAQGGLSAWVREVAALTDPTEVVWCDGSDDERDRLTRKLIEAGTFIPQDFGPWTFRCALDPEDIAEVGRHTYICCREKADVDPDVPWMEPVDMKIILSEEYRGCMRGRTMYVVPFRLGPSPQGRPVLGVQITDSAYVVVSMHLMLGDAAMGLAFFDDDAEFARCVHSVGAPRRPGQPDVPWPCDHTKYVAQFPEISTIYNYGFGFVDNAFLGTDLDLSRVPLAVPSTGSAPTAVAEARRAESTFIESWFAYNKV